MDDFSWKKAKFETVALHSGYKIDTDTLARAVPIHRTTSYVFKNAQHAQDLFALKEAGNIYTRLMNPTHDVLEKRVAELEGGAAAVAVASGTAAVYYAILTICKQGDEIVSANNLYGGTYTMFGEILPQYGINTRLVSPRRIGDFEKAINEKTKAIFVETIGNPGLDVIDMEAVAKVAQKAHLPLIVDSTFTTPYLMRPIEYGADIVIHSLTKWIGGHGTAIGGIAVDAGKFDWTDKKFTLFNEPDASYHDLRWAHDLGENNPIAFATRFRLVPLRNLGACISPDNAWIFLQGLETLALRMERHCSNAMAVAEFLQKHPNVDWVKYPGLNCHPTCDAAKKYLKNGFGGMVVFGVKGGRAAGAKFIENLKLFSHLANVGDAKSLAIHPATTTHSQLTPEQLKDGELSESLIRLSIGIEHIDDILADLEQALKL